MSLRNGGLDGCRDGTTGVVLVSGLRRERSDNKQATALWSSSSRPPSSECGVKERSQSSGDGERTGWWLEPPSLVVW